MVEKKNPKNEGKRWGVFPWYSDSPGGDGGESHSGVTGRDRGGNDVKPSFFWVVGQKKRV